MADFDTNRGIDYTAKGPANEDQQLTKTALQRYARWYERERDNVDQAYSDLNFCWADEQWSAADLAERKDRPSLVNNRLPQFIHQVTGDMRKMRPSIHVVPVDSAGDKDTAKTIAGMIRYIENRSYANAIYTTGADSQVSCGIGAWRITTEYAGDSTFNQECRICGVSDAVGIAWDPDAELPNREDAKWCIVPVDMSRDAFKENYPDVSVEDFDTIPIPSGGASNYYQGWFSKDMVRVAEYWLKEPTKRKLALMPDGAIVDLTGKDEQEIAKVLAGGARVEDRPSFKVKRYLITAAHVLEKADWPGMHIPIIPVIGEEIKIGRKTVRRGLIRTAKDPQKILNFMVSAQAEAVALQPKAPFLVTETNIRKYQIQWGDANVKNLPYLPYEPDPSNGGAAPQRITPPVSSQGITEAIGLAVDNIKAVIGIYDASLGQRSNETSGRAINARKEEGDTGTYVYIDNWTRAIMRTGQILVDLFPHIYDTQRMIRIMGEDGKVDLKHINRPMGAAMVDPMTGQMVEPQIENDITVGAYDVVMETGPSYSTKREEARANMVEFIRSAPDIAPATLDLVAKAQDWPLADEFAQRLEVIAPPPVQKLIAKQKQEQGEEEQPDPPSPAEQLAQQKAQAEVDEQVWKAKKLQAETVKIAHEANPDQAQPADPVAMVEAENKRIESEAKRQQMACDFEMHELDKQIKQVELEIQLVKLAQAKAAGVTDTMSAVLDVKAQQDGMQRDADAHTTALISGAQESERATAAEGRTAEMHAAKLKQMNKPQPAAP